MGIAKADKFVVDHLRGELKSEWKDVCQKYPLVALAVIMQRPSYQLDPELVKLAPELGLDAEIDQGVATQVGLRVKKCFAQFMRLVGDPGTNPRDVDRNFIHNCMTRRE